VTATDKTPNRQQTCQSTSQHTGIWKDELNAELVSNNNKC